MNLIDSIVVDEALRDAANNKQVVKVRTEVLSIYNGTHVEDFDGDWEEAVMDPMRPMKHNPTPPTYIEPTEMGYAGLEAPIN